MIITKQSLMFCVVIKIYELLYIWSAQWDWVLFIFLWEKLNLKLITVCMKAGRVNMSWLMIDIIY